MIPKKRQQNRQNEENQCFLGIHLVQSIPTKIYHVLQNGKGIQITRFLENRT